jgi:hypothetical protein
LELTAATAGAPPPRTGHACADVAMSRSTPDLRPRRQRTAPETRRAARKGSATTRGRRPRRRHHRPGFARRVFR